MGVRSKKSETCRTKIAVIIDDAYHDPNLRPLTFVDFNSNHVNIKRSNRPVFISFYTYKNLSTSRSQTFILIRTLVNIMLLSLEELLQNSLKRINFYKSYINIVINFFPKK